MANQENPLTIEYKNWRGEVSMRSILPRRVYFSSNEWHTTPQWLLEAWDIDKDAIRIFAMQNMKPSP